MRTVEQWLGEEVVVYGAKVCPKCQVYKKYLDDNNVEYKYYNIDEIDYDIVSVAKADNVYELPIIEVNKKIIRLGDIYEY